MISATDPKERFRSIEQGQSQAKDRSSSFLSASVSFSVSLSVLVWVSMVC